jgi:hypothetical protein
MQPTLIFDIREIFSLSYILRTLMPVAAAGLISFHTGRKPSLWHFALASGAIVGIFTCQIVMGLRGLPQSADGPEGLRKALQDMN